MIYRKHFLKASTPPPVNPRSMVSELVIVLTNTGKVSTGYYDSYRNEWIINNALSGETAVEWTSMEIV